MRGAYSYHIKLLFKRILFLLVLFQVGRIYFFTVNYSRYSDLPLGDILQSFVVGIRFDLAAITMFNSVFIIFSLLPFRVLLNKYYQWFLKYLFVIVNFFLLSANVIDSHYFPFTQKRSTFDLSHTILDSDFFSLLYEYSRDYWFALVFSLVLTVILFRFYPKAKQKEWQVNTPFLFFKRFLVVMMFIGLFLVAARGVGYRPIAITSAAQWTHPKTIALTLNTPFTIIKTIYKKGLNELHYFDDNQLKTIFNPIRNYSNGAFRRKNVVVLILESFGKEYSDYNSLKSITYTPFLDSLSRQALYFNYSFANGQISMESVSSILNSSPSLMSTPYLISPYASNRVDGLANLLSKEGYYTAFMHGGNNGSMDFDKFAFMSGFKDYYGKNEYGNLKDYDGNWGIFDEPFLQYSIREMNTFKRPFFTTIFTLSSHHPYTIPECYKGVFKEGSLKIHKSVLYADFALKQFFKEAQKQDWFNNTLFVITADHTSISETSYYQHGMGAYAVPIIFYSPQDSLLKGSSDKLVCHTDIMPGILDYLHYPDSFYAMGKSVFDSLQPSYFLNYRSNKYLFSDDSFYAEILEDSVMTVYRYKTDSLLTNNLLKDKQEQKTDSLRDFLEQKKLVFKAMKQTYNNNLIYNRSYYSNFKIEKQKP